MGLEIDARMAAVLDGYHHRIEREADIRREADRVGNKDDRRDEFLLAVGPESGRLLNILASSLDKPHIVELGTSYGYSTIWLAEAARASGGRVTTMELQDHKSAHAREMATKAGLEAYVDFQVGDALDLIAVLPAGVDFVLVDLWKDLYTPCFEALLPKLNPGAILVADNIIRPGKGGTAEYVRAVRATPGMHSLLLPVGAGLELSRYEMESVHARRVT